MGYFTLVIRIIAPLKCLNKHIDNATFLAIRWSWVFHHSQSLHYYYWKVLVRILCSLLFNLIWCVFWGFTYASGCLQKFSLNTNRVKLKSCSLFITDHGIVEKHSTGIPHCPQSTYVYVLHYWCEISLWILRNSSRKMSLLKTWKTGLTRNDSI